MNKTASVGVSPRNYSHGTTNYLERRGRTIEFVARYDKPHGICATVAQTRICLTLKRRDANWFVARCSKPGISRRVLQIAGTPARQRHPKTDCLGNSG
jgi:hypothetical protein